MSKEEVFTIFFVIAGIIMALLLFMGVLYSLKHKKRHSEFRNIKTGARESEIVAAFGVPEKTVIVDEATKVIIYKDIQPVLIFFQTVKEIHISVKDGIVTNIVF